jgi:hypothetical protein
MRTSLITDGENFMNRLMDDKMKRQRGAALITVLMISTLLLATGGALVLVTGMSSRTAIDATAEMQAYYAAETGLQDAMNVLRGNVNPSASMPAGTTIDFRKAVTASGSNVNGDTKPSCQGNAITNHCRLSGWLTYSYSSDSGDRVPMPGVAYNPITGLAYSVDVSDPDQTPVANGEPSRLLLRVVGYGPKGAEKHLELIVKRTNLVYTPQCVICVRSSDGGDPVNFSIGESAAKSYSGEDRNGGSKLPAFGATTDVDTALQRAAVNKDTVSDPAASRIDMSQLPSWLQDANAARDFLEDQRQNAVNQGRYFSSYSGYSGTDTQAKFTFVDGDCSLDGGSGLLIVTGKLLMKGNPSFKGLILVLGDGYVERDGGGSGDIYGAMFVARFNKNGGPFLASTFITNGGGNSTVQNDSQAWGNAENLSGPRVAGVHEN